MGGSSRRRLGSSQAFEAPPSCVFAVYLLTPCGPLLNKAFKRKSRLCFWMDLFTWPKTCSVGRYRRLAQLRQTSVSGQPCFPCMAKKSKAPGSTNFRKDASNGNRACKKSMNNMAFGTSFQQQSCKMGIGSWWLYDCLTAGRW